MKNVIVAGVVCVFASTRDGELVNPGFEYGGGSLTGWTAFDNALLDNTISRNASGNSVKMYGNFGFEYNAAGVFQQFPAAANETWTGTAYFQTSLLDTIVGTTNFAALNIEWINASGGQISYISQRATDGTSPADTGSNSLSAASLRLEPLLRELFRFSCNPASRVAA